MFARAAFRAAQPLKMNARRFAAEAGPGSKTGGEGGEGGGRRNAVLMGLGATALAGAALWTMGRDGDAAATAAQEAASKAKQVAGGGAAPRPTFTDGDQGFVSLKLAEVETVNHNTKRFRFELPKDDMVSGLHVASAVLTKFKGATDDKATLRPYTPISDEADQGFLDLLVKKYPGGPMSTHLHDMAPGQRLDFKGPLPKYPWTENKHEHIGLIAGGTGITPMYQLLRAVLNNPRDRTKVTLVFANVSEDDILLRKQLADLENTHPQRFRAFYLLDKPPPGWPGARGYITSDLLKTVLPEPSAGSAIKLFVCGPPSLMNAVSGNKVSPKDQGELAGALKELGYSKDQVYKF